MTRVRPARAGAALAASAALALSACGGSAGDDGPAPPGVAGAPRAEQQLAGIGGDARPADTTTNTAATRATSRTGWPRSLSIGLIDQEDGAAKLRGRAPFGLRWHYLSGGAGTDGSWDTWRTGGGSYASAYVEDARANGTIPFLSYYVLQETPPTASAPDETQKVLRGLASRKTMRAVVADLRLALTRMGAAAGDGPAVLQVEPDLWGYVQQHAGGAGGASTPARIKGTDRRAKGLPNTVAGFARLVTRIRDEVAPNVLLAYPVSIWGTNKDIVGSDPSAADVERMIGLSTAFWRSLGRPFDLLTFEFANRTAGYQEKVDGVAARDAQWTAENYDRHVEFVRGVLRGTKRPGVLWQVPPGNTVSPVMDDTPGHYRDDKVQALLGAPGRPLLRRYRDAGVVAVLFGSAFPDDTCACVRTDDHATAGGGEDDGGYLTEQVRRYGRGALGTSRRVRVVTRGK
ncbi:hypothetical protein [Patulibacter sp. SYSU D01012]|uniref:hypothetical protein n=1 Tax=Patulibacter sp. SYSU D01012 TaxID=2817381 RepID=UPI001B313E21|nr:hypothetical protein [Patulibacter sp. SYSU D01012]